jgi:zinc protease
MRQCRFYHVIFLFLVVMLCGPSVCFSRGTPQSFTLQNGMGVILNENHNSPVAALQVWVRVGSADETDEEAGICHFIEHLLFKGTERRRGRIAAEIEALGGHMNAYTSYDQTVYHLVIASRHAKMGLDVLADAVVHSIFGPQEIDREREVILEEIRMGQDSPSRAISKQTMAAVFQVHPYGRPVIGNEKTVRAITRDRIVSFFKKWYVPKNMVFSASGDFDGMEMRKGIEEAFSGWNVSSGDLPGRKTEPEPVEFRSVVSSGNFKETYLQLAFPITAVTDEETPAMDVLAQILGGGEASRLVQRVKLEKGLVRSVSASSYTPKDRGTFLVGATLVPENVERGLAAILEEIVRLMRGGVSPEELYRAKVGIRSGLIYGRQSVQGEAGKLGFYGAIVGDLGYEKEYMRRVDLLESEDIERVAEKYFRPSRAVASILGPAEKAAFFKGLALKRIVENAGMEASGREAPKTSALSMSVLKNGIRLIVKENRSVPAVTLNASFLGGVRFEDEASNGINNFMAVMLTRGTNHRNNIEIAKKVETMAGSLGGFSGYNSFGLNFTFLSEHFEEAFALFVEILMEPSFDGEEMEKRRPLIIGAIERQEDDLSGVVFRGFRKALFQRHPYRMDPLGTASSILSLTREDLRRYYRKFAVPENTVLTVVGDVDPARVLSAAERSFGQVEGGHFSHPRIGQEEPPGKVRTETIYRNKEQAHFVLGFPGASFRDGERYALEVVDAALSGQGGRLFRQLRDQESLAYSVSFVGQPNLDPGFIGLYMGTHPAKLDTAIESALRELRKLKSEGLTPEEVERAKRYLIGNFEIGLQTNGAQANQIGLDELYGKGYDHATRYADEISRVTIEQVRRAIDRYLRLDAYTLAVIRPAAEEKR